jgi:hypothetical protein
MSTVLDQAAALAAAAGLGALIVGVLAARAWREPLRMALDLWVAAGLIRLAEPPGRGALLSAAVILAVRQVVSFGLRHSARVS